MPYEEGYFGNCPICHQTEGYWNVRNKASENWFYCVAHKLRWCVGTGLFSMPCVTEEEKAYLEGFTEISPDETWYPPSQVAEGLLQHIDDPPMPPLPNF